MRFAMPAKQRVVQDEHGCELARPPACGGERRVVLDAEIAPEPVNDPHRGVRISWPRHEPNEVGSGPRRTVLPFRADPPAFRLRSGSRNPRPGATRTGPSPVPASTSALGASRVGQNDSTISPSSTSAPGRVLPFSGCVTSTLIGGRGTPEVSEATRPSCQSGVREGERQTCIL